MAGFVFLEIADRDLNGLFAGMAQIIYGFRPDRPTHLTIRGPYAAGVPRAVVERCRAAMKQDVLRIANVGRFSNPEEEVVFLTVDSPNLRRVWWKRDYPIERFGFNPHVSIYRGPDSVLAEALQRFFQHEQLELLCAEFRIVNHITKQGDIFALGYPLASHPFHRVLRGSVQENLLPRLEVVVQRLRRRRQAGHL